MGKQTTLEERILFCELADAGYSDGEIAQTVGWSVSTVRKWRRLGRRGRVALASEMGRPATGALSTFTALTPCSTCDPKIRETLQRWREAHPGWGPGPRTLLAELKRDNYFARLQLPSERTRCVANFLKERDMSRTYERHSPLPQPKVTATTPHELWEMDARGHERVPDIGMVALINLNDRCSRVRLPTQSDPCWLGRQRLERYALACYGRLSGDTASGPLPNGACPSCVT